MGARRHGQEGARAPLWKCKVFCVLVVTAKRSTDELFMHYFHWGDFHPRPIICPPLKNPSGAHARQWVIHVARHLSNWLSLETGCVIRDFLKPASTVTDLWIRISVTVRISPNSRVKQSFCSAFALQHAAISKFHAARRTLEAVHLLSPGRCSGTDFLQKSGQTTHCRVSSLSLRHTISDSNHL